jgi:hypothetical protein
MRGPSVPMFDSAPPSEPEAITVAFIADYKVWNDFAFASHQATGDFEPAERSYDALIAKYCRPGKQRLALGFGSDSSPSPEGSEIIGVKGKGDRKKVTVRETTPSGYQPTYEFDFMREDGRWFLDELYFIDDGNRNRRVRGL